MNGTQGAIIDEPQAGTPMTEFHCTLSSKQLFIQRPSPVYASSVSKRPSPSFTTETTATASAATVQPGSSVDEAASGGHCLYLICPHWLILVQVDHHNTVSQLRMVIVVVEDQ
jgi:hypothetical protein